TPLIVSGFPAPRVGCRNRRAILSRRPAILPAYSHTDDLVSPVVRNENGRSVPAAILREFLGNNNGMRRGVIGRRKNRSGFVRIPAAVVNVEIKPASFSRNLCLRYVEYSGSRRRETLGMTPGGVLQRDAREIYDRID